MKKAPKLFLFCALVGVRPTLAVNDFWAGSDYSVTLRYLGVVETNVDMPKPRSAQMPAYPVQELKAAASGEVILSFLVTRDGKVRDILSEKNEPSDMIESACEAVRQWTFYPAVSLSHPDQKVDSHVRCRFRFEAHEN